MKTHTLKTWNDYFDDIAFGDKSFEVRKDDRNYEVGDTLILQRYNPNTKEYDGCEVSVKVKYILRGGSFGIEEGHVVMGIE
jgi:hypothetical protein